MQQIKGAGLGLRSEHFETIIQDRPDIPWFEVLADNYLVDGGRFVKALEIISEYYPLVMHSVGMNLGSPEKLDKNYIARLKTLAKRFEMRWFSDHLAWTQNENRHHHDLLPLPFNKKVLQNMVEKIKELQGEFEIPFLIENPTYYLRFKESTMQEWDFMMELAQKASCYILLDVNNIYVNSQNHGYDKSEYLRNISPEKVLQMHIAGFTQREEVLIDTHGAPIADVVWEFAEEAFAHLGPKPICVERDSDIPEFTEVYAEMNKAQSMMDTSVVAP